MSGTQSSLNASGSTQNLFFAQGAGTVLPPYESFTTPMIYQSFTALPATSGCTYLMGCTGAARIVTLPPVATAGGCKWNFMCGQTGAGQTWTITPATSVLYGTLSQGATTTPTIILKSAGATAVMTGTRGIGDNVTITSDAVNYYISGNGGSAASFS